MKNTKNLFRCKLKDYEFGMDITCWQTCMLIGAQEQKLLSIFDRSMRELWNHQGRPRRTVNTENESWSLKYQTNECHYFIDLSKLPQILFKECKPQVIICIDYFVPYFNDLSRFIPLNSVMILGVINCLLTYNLVQ